MNRQRKPTETFKEYRRNLQNEEYARKVASRGRLIWNSKIQGTYRRGDL